LTATPSTVRPLSQTVASGSGWSPNEVVDLTLFSTPVSLGSAHADATGAFSMTVTIPADTSLGTHDLVAQSQDRARQASARLNVVGATSVLGATFTAGGLALTGPDIDMMVLAALFCIGLGAVPVLAYRRETSAARARRRL
jgi:hypothetical protein